MDISEENIVESKEQIKKFRIQRKRIIRKYIKQVLNPLLPNARISSIYSAGIPGQPFNNAKLTLRPTNQTLFKSKYYFQKKLQLIHYTSLRNAISIIREKSIRLYDLNSMNDPLELSHTMKNLDPSISDYNLYEWKKTAFCFSMCDYRREEDLESFDNWRLYGNDGKGVGIVLTLPKYSQKDWFNLFLSNVFYKQGDLNKLKRAYSRHKNFDKENEFSIRNPLKTLLFNISCFHKVGIYENENEVRLLKIIEKNNVIISKQIELDLIENKRSHFTRIKLINDDADKKYRKENFDNEQQKKLVKMFPLPKIKEIVLGYRFSEKDEYEIRNVIKELSLENLGYEINVKRTELRQYFNT